MMEMGSRALGRWKLRWACLGGRRGKEDARVIMGQTDQIDPRQVMQVDRRVGTTGARDPGPEMDVIARVEEILYVCSEFVCLSLSPV